jgi:hypothetical protein
LRAVSFRDERARGGELMDSLENAVALGVRLAEKLK